MICNAVRKLTNEIRSNASLLDASFALRNHAGLGLAVEHVGVAVVQVGRAVPLVLVNIARGVQRLLYLHHLLLLLSLLF